MALKFLVKAKLKSNLFLIKYVIQSKRATISSSGWQSTFRVCSNVLPAGKIFYQGITTTNELNQ